MLENPINYFAEKVEFQIKFPEEHSFWLTQVALNENVVLGCLNFVFCTDQYLLDINKQYLSHDYYTDVITFDQSGEGNSISGDIFISIDRASENANTFGLCFDVEIRRLLVHGLLHLVGYDDKIEDEKRIMTEREDYYLSLWSQKN